MKDFEHKKVFLYQGALLYNHLIGLAPDDTIRRYLAFKIIVDTMSFEDIVNNRAHARIRQIRNVLLAHKQESDFFEGYKANDEIRDTTISSLIEFMGTQVDASQQTPVVPELVDPSISIRFENLAHVVLNKYYRDNVAGFRVTNNFLCFTGSQIHEITKNDLAGCFYRYNSSKELFNLAQYLFNNLRLDVAFENATRHVKRDIILHAVNMTDCIYKDAQNPYSIDGLYQLMQRDNIGSTESLDTLVNNGEFNTEYREIRDIRNKFVGHMDMNIPLTDIMERLDNLPIEKVYKLYNRVDSATCIASRSHIVIKKRYDSLNTPLTQLPIIDVPGLKPTPYF